MHLSNHAFEVTTLLITFQLSELVLFALEKTGVFLQLC